MASPSSSPSSKVAHEVERLNGYYSKVTIPSYAVPDLLKEKGMRFTRRFTHPGSNPLDEVVYEKRTSRITNPDGSVVF